MPKYIFEWSDHQEPTAVDIDNDDEVWSEAVSSMGQLLRDLNGNMVAPYHLSLKVFDSIGQMLAVIIVEARRNE